MEYELGKWLERVEAKLNAVLQLNGLDPNTLQELEPLPKTSKETVEPQAPESQVAQEQVEAQEELDLHEEEVHSKQELESKADSLKKAMSKRRVDVNGQPIGGEN